MVEKEKNEWTDIIRANTNWFDFHLDQLWSFRDLLFLFVRRDFVSVYKQTILGPLWFFIQPVLTSLTFTFIFSGLAKISTDGLPAILFYMAGITLWTYFADCLNKTSSTFIANAGIFGKVYFPRLIMPLSVLISNLIKLGIQVLIFISIWIYFLSSSDKIHPQWQFMWFLPILVFMMAGLGLGFGVLISSLTTKYRDLTFLVGFGVQLLMYGSSVIIPISSIKTEKIKMLMLLNPLTSIIETFKYIFLGNGFLSWHYLLYSMTFMVVLLFISIIVFNKVEKSFMDTV
ncbi:MAG: ABC transporter permease [Bacteroidetes bacterium]|nr:ABC transporter permease [Bacteroidota bacterium]